MMVKLRNIAFLFAGLTPFSALAEQGHDHAHHSHGAHVHGAWDMFAALDGDALSISLKGPIIDMLGFEAAPASDEERQAVHELSALLKKPEIMLSLDQRASCVLASPVTVALPQGFAPEDAPGHDHHEHEDDHDHSHDNEKPHNANIHDSDIEVTYAFTCGAPTRLGSITMTGFQQFSAISTVDAVFLSDTTQSAHRLERRSEVFNIN